MVKVSETNPVKLSETEHIGLNARCFNDDVICQEDGVLIRSSNTLIPALYPRDAAINGSTVYIADTFNHKVVAHDLLSNLNIWEVDSYFPNSIQVVNDYIVVAEEHANRIVKINIHNQTKTILYGCNQGIFTDPLATHLSIIDREKSGELTKDGYSICHGGTNLYSPNGAQQQSDESLLIADTDNHRIIQVNKSGEIIREIINFNNPTRALFIQ